MRWFCYLALACLSVVSAHTFADETQIKQACTDLVLDYAFYRDRLDAEPYAQLFAEDAVLTVLGQVFQGRVAIKKRMLESKDGPVTRHMMSTIRIFPIDSHSASGVSYVTVYSAPAGELPLKVEQFLGLGEYHDKFVLTEQGWKISRRTFVPVFMN
ncbi:MAG: nuclear transport factor 2 family protein [Pseudomonadota bacterium]